MQHLSSLFVNDARVYNADLTNLLSKTLAQALLDPTHEYTETNRSCCLTPVPSCTWPSVLYGQGVVAASSESADPL